MSEIHNYNDDSSSDEDDYTDFMICHFLFEFEKRNIPKTPCRTSILSGKMYALEVLAGNKVRCFENFRMEKTTFVRLCNTLKEMHLLHDRKEVCVEEGVAMFLFIISHNVRHRVVAERFQHSTETVCRWFRRVLRAICELGTQLIRPKNQGSVAPEILHNPKYFPYFQNCIGAIDGTHVAAWSPTSKQNSFRGRKVLVTQNVMAACSFDMLFTFVYTGWEGTANDARVFLDAITRPENEFPMPNEGHYYVVDSGYPNTPGFLAPYRNERYHLRDYREQGLPRGRVELFNYRHSSLRNVIERCFGVLKARFPILKMIPNYPLRRQRMIPLACCTMHNFIRLDSTRDTLFEDYLQEGFEAPNDSNTIEQQSNTVDLTQTNIMAQVREDIATSMWNNYRNQ